MNPFNFLQHEGESTLTTYHRFVYLFAAVHAEAGSSRPFENNISNPTGQWGFPLSGESVRVSNMQNALLTAKLMPPGNHSA